MQSAELSAHRPVTAPHSWGPYSCTQPPAASAAHARLRMQGRFSHAQAARLCGPLLCAAMCTPRHLQPWWRSPYQDATIVLDAARVSMHAVSEQWRGLHKPVGDEGTLLSFRQAATDNCAIDRPGGPFASQVARMKPAGLVCTDHAELAAQLR